MHYSMNTVIDLLAPLLAAGVAGGAELARLVRHILSLTPIL